MCSGIMTRDDNCQGCAQQHDCKSIYRTLGRAGGPSVVWKVVFVFLVPIAVFVVSIAGLGAVLKERITSETARMAVVFVLALLASLAAAGLIRWLVPAWGRKSGTEPDRKNENGNTRKIDI